ncbi:HNH endonuclease signature motif containing protein [Methylibium sp.]|uniref:HNH endonuclease signature motif containing protein n=1 Tax=Methylibium sp. TaxID=2067992 RepID=UPI003BAA6293
MATTDLTAQRLRELLHYDPETGAIYKRVGHLTTHGYQRVYVDGRPYQLHRLAWMLVHGAWPTDHIDHLNGDRSDNRLSNLRDVPKVTNQQNERRARKNSRSGLLGASWSKAMKRWTARIHHDGKHHFLGYFDTAEEAHSAYLSAKRKHHAGCTL